MKRGLILALSLLLAWSSAQFIAYVDIGKRARSALAELSGADFDQALLSQFIAYDEAVEALARQSLQASQRDDVLKAAQAVLESRTREREQLSTWLETWYGAEPSQLQIDTVKADLKAMLDMTLEYMTPMEGMKMPIDHSFLEAMMVLSKQVLSLTEQCLAKATRADLQTFCEAVRDYQAEETAQFKTWYDAGY
jgi:uncharacterized protein (DUF305 family)